MLHLTTLAAVALAGQANPDWNDIVQKNFRDAFFVAKVVRGNQAELKKINGDFAYSYRFTTTTARVKEPFKMRLEAVVEDAKLLYIINGAKKHYNVDNKLKGVDDVSKAPGKRQTTLDFGILTPSLFDDLFVAKFVRTDRESGNWIFDITYTKNDNSRHRVWVDKDKKFITRRAWFNQEGLQLATFIYENPKNEGGVWFPTKCTVKNVEDKVAGITEYQRMAINKGIDDAMFRW
ncbi:MAG: outer membrane lipoprotein-sorting protein [Methanoregulaceae archaeon]|jgi:outer membrane lipoprotein-sorting protein|nr:outer membrane lipoprotein-sorting protein [Methanoregulaceae archaeon]